MLLWARDDRIVVRLLWRRRRRWGWRQERREQYQFRESFVVEQGRQKQAADRECLHGKRDQGCPAPVRMAGPVRASGEIGKHGVLLNVDVTMSKDTRQRIFRRNSKRNAARKKAASARGLRELFRDTGCREKGLSQNYGCKPTSWVECLVAWALPALWSPALPWALPVWLRRASGPAPAHLTARCKAQPPAG